MLKNSFVIAVDGPAGSGKTTMAMLLARALGIRYLNTGAMYRAFAFHALRRGFKGLEDIPGLLEGFHLEFRENGNSQRVFLCQEDVTERLSTPEIDRLSSELSTQRAVRDAITRLQKMEAEKGPVVAEGRDMGTVVFPDASVKFFLTASKEERAKRRWSQLRLRGGQVELEKVLLEITERDERDMQRAIAPLRPAEDAIVIDTTGVKIEKVLEILLSYTRQLVK